MSTIALLLAISLPIISAIIILWPLFRGASMPTADPEGDRSDLSRLREQRDQTLQTIQDLDQELGLGNITAEDHRSLRARYVRQAALIIREIEGREQVLEDEIEQALRRRRARRAGTAAATHSSTESRPHAPR